MNRVYNFSAGPSMLPQSVLETAAAELLDFGGSGMSVMEMSHRSKIYQEIIDQTEARLRSIMKIPDNYKVLFLHGGATMQFAMVPMNLLTKTGKADYIVTGEFAKKACQEAQKFGQINVCGSSEGENFTHIPQQADLRLDNSADYLHICYNNTIFGTRFNYIPQTDAPVVADMSSCILSQEFDVSKFGLIYAGAQKNMGPAGFALVIVREDLIGKTLPNTPVMLDYAVQAKSGSMYNTPSTYPIYVCGLVLKWIEELGGVAAIEKINNQKAGALYDYLDNSKLFKPVAHKEYRSIMNVVFNTGCEETDAAFIKFAAQKGLVNLKGHRATGGIRASIYNAMPLEGVLALVAAMREFEAQA